MQEWRTNGKYDTSLYAVDITTGETTRLSNINERYTFSCLWASGDDPSDGAGIDIINPDINPDNAAFIDLSTSDNGGISQLVELGMQYTYILRPAVGWKVNSVTFNKIDLSGDMAYANAAFNWSDNEAQTENWLYYNTTMEDISNTAAVYGAANVMIPQAANAQTTITVNYTMTQPGSAPISGEVSVAAPQVWVAGSKYVYTLNFNLNEILFNPSVTDWATVTVDTIDISL